MSDFGKSILLATLLIVLAGCDVFDDGDNDGVNIFNPDSWNPDASNPDISNPDTSSPPGAADYLVTVESADMINIDSGQPIAVDGFPLQGSALTVE
ncbi:MAG: hypothetical protein ACN4GT_09720 [Gammaproteobacteria bacterium]